MDKKVLVVSNTSVANTGFGKNMRVIMKHLASKGFDLVELAIGGRYAFNDPRLKRLPWKTYGSIPQTEQFNQYIQSASPGERDKVLKLASYGNFVIDDVVNTEKPTHVIFIEDPWAITEIYRKPWWDKINCLFWTPLDSLPVADFVIDQVKTCKHYAVCMSFPVEELKIKTGKTVQVLHNNIPMDEYDKPFLDESKRREVRSKLGLEDEDLLVMMNARNQPRKLFWVNLEAAKSFKKNNPQKIKLLFNTHFSEGWNLQKQIEEYGLSKDVLVPYICRECKSWNISHYVGDNQNCPVCSSEKSFSTPSSQEGISEETLRLLYMISDCYSHPVTNGGFEIPVFEAALSRCIVGTIPYSFGKDFVECEHIFSFDGNYSKCHKTSFFRYNPDPKSVCEFFENVAKLSRQERIELGEKTETWARNKFSGSVEWLENWINSNEPKDYDFSVETVVPNPSFEFPEIESNEDFVDSLYENILKISDPKGKQDWLQALKSGRSKRDVYDYFVRTAISLIPEKKEHVKDDKSYKVTHVIPGDALDCLQCLKEIERIQKIYPDSTLCIACKQEYFHFFDFLDAKFLELTPELTDRNFMIGAGQEKPLFDVVYIWKDGKSQLLS